MGQREWVSPENVFSRTAQLEIVAHVDPIILTMIRTDEEDYVRAEIFIAYANPAAPYPSTVNFAGLGDSIETAIESLSRAVDDWYVTQTLNIPMIYREGKRFFKSTDETEEAPTSEQYDGYGEKYTATDGSDT